MTKLKTSVLIGLVLAAAAFFVVRYMGEFSRLKRVEIGNAPTALGTINKVVLTNNSSSKVVFPLRCYAKVRSGGKALFSQVVSLPPNESVELDINPELAGRDLPRMIPNKACEAIWQGPFGIERGAWWVNWQYAKPAHKVMFQ